MKNFRAQVIVKIKPEIKDIKGLSLKQAIDGFLPLENLRCRAGSFYELEFSAHSIEDAEISLKRIAQEILSNDIIETYEITKPEEFHEKN